MRDEIKSFFITLIVTLAFIILINIISEAVTVAIHINKPEEQHVYTCIDGYAFEKISIDGGNYTYEPVFSDNNLKKCTEMLEESIRDGFERIR